MTCESHFTLKSLKEQVYDYLRVQMNEGRLRPGAFLNLNDISRELGMSRTPLRDALFQLESEGFVTIFPRRGVVVNSLTLEKIRNIYEILGALESAALLLVAVRFRDGDADLMEKYNQQMRKALDHNNFSVFYEANLRFHNVYLDMLDNAEMLHAIKIRKERLYDFPRNKTFVKEWEPDQPTWPPLPPTPMNNGYDVHQFPGSRAVRGIQSNDDVHGSFRMYNDSHSDDNPKR